MNAIKGERPIDISGKVSEEWWHDATWLSEAGQAFGNPSFAAQRMAAANRFKELGNGDTVETFARSSRLLGPARDRELAKRLVGDRMRAWVEYYAAWDALERDLHFKLTWGTLLAFGDKNYAGAQPE